MKFLRGFSWTMFLSMLALVALGTLVIYSAGNARTEAVFHGMWRINLVTAAFALVAYFLLAFFDYRRYLKWTALPAYLIALGFLALVLVVGDKVYGGRRWLWFFQPSEIAKLTVIALFAWIFGRERPRLGRGFKAFFESMALLAVPAVLILAEPDLGTALTLVPAVLLLLFAAAVWRTGLTVALASACVLVLGVLGAVRLADAPGTSAERRAAILRFVPLKEHQLRRVRVFLSPESDPTGAGYNLRQAKISIGSGGFRGKGIGKGDANHLKYLPQAISMNDFIFCVFAEENGFVGSVVLLALFGALLCSAARIASVADEATGQLFALGFSTLVFAHVFINIAMSIGLVPITGLPLPFISAGRTFLVTVMAGFGIVQSIAIHGRSQIK